APLGRQSAEDRDRRVRRMPVQSKIIMGIACVALLLATMLGAYGSHVLRPSAPAEAWAAYQTAVQYHFYHGLGLFALGLVWERTGRPWLAGLCAAALCAGLLLFCGGIYASSSAPWLRPVVPLGGV